MKTREDEIKEMQEREEKCQKWVYGTMVVCLVLMFLFMIFDSKADTTTIIMPDGSIIQCSTDSTGIVVCV